MRISPTCRNCARPVQMTDCTEASTYREAIKAGQRQVDERADAVLQELENPNEGFRPVYIRPPYGGWVLDAPMRD